MKILILCSGRITNSVDTVKYSIGVPDYYLTKKLIKIDNYNAVSTSKLRCYNTVVKEKQECK